MTGARLRVGIAGAGWVATERHLPVLLARPDVDVVAVYDRQPERARALCERAQHRGGVTPSADSNLDTFLARGLDVVHVTTSPWSHHEVALQALQAGAHVFTEKPMAMNLVEAQQMADAARDAGRLLCVSHNFLYSSSMRRGKEQLRGAPVDYVLGLQLSAESRRLPSWYRSLPGGLMFDEVPHMVYSLTDLLGGDLVLDHARATFDDDRQPRTVEALVRGRTGSGQVTMVFCAPVSEWHLMLSSRSRLVGLDLFRDIAIDLAPDGKHSSFDIARTSLSAVAGHVAGFARAGTRWMSHRQWWGHDVLIGEFLDAIHNRDLAPVSIDAALGVVRITDSLLASLDIATPVRDP